MPRQLSIKLYAEKLVITGAYDKDFVEALKQYVPHTARQWDQDEKTWTVESYYEGQVLKAARDGEFDAVFLEFTDDNGDYVIRNLTTGEETRTSSLF